MTNIIFDFDSTIIKTEGLEELAAIVLKENPNKDKILREMVRITNLGMTGKIKFKKSLVERMKLISPDQVSLNKLEKVLKKKTTDSILRNKDIFTNKNLNIYIVSGGFKEFIIPVARSLKIKEENIFANDFIFAGKNYVGINKKNTMLKSQGKAKTIEQIGLDPEETIVIGDGFTDYEIKESGVANTFILFIENVLRKDLVDKSDFIAKSMDDVISYLQDRSLL